MLTGPNFCYNGKGCRYATVELGQEVEMRYTGEGD